MILVGADQQPVTLQYHFDLGEAIGMVSVIAGISTNGLGTGYGHLVGVGPDHLDVASRILKDDSFGSLGRRAGGDRIIVRLAPPV